MYVIVLLNMDDEMQGYYISDDDAPAELIDDAIVFNNSEDALKCQNAINNGWPETKAAILEH